MKKEQIKQVNFLLAAIASHYMESFQGDILYDQLAIVERLEELGEIELYIGTRHFDTEIRFQHDGMTVEQARERAHSDHWADWTITLMAISPDEIRAIIEKTREDAKDFPFLRLYSWTEVENLRVFSSKLDNNV